MRKILIALVFLSSVLLSMGIKAGLGLAQQSVKVLTHSSFELLEDSGGSNTDDGGVHKGDTDKGGTDKGGTKDDGGGENGEGGEGGGEDFPVLG